MTLRADSARPDASAAALAEVETQLRDLIRSRGIDPAKDVATARGLVQEALDTYREQTLGADLPAIADHDLAAQSLYDVVAGFGPLQRHLDDPEVEELWINERLRGGRAI